MVSISCVVDYGNYWKKLFFVFGWIGSGSVMFYIFVFKDFYFFGVLLVIILNIFLGVLFVLLNLFLLFFVRYYFEVEYVVVLDESDVDEVEDEFVVDMDVERVMVDLIVVLLLR